MKFKGRPYQVRALDFIYKHPKCALNLDMGLGKTIVAASLVSHLKKKGEAYRTVIFAPIRVATMVWKQEFEKWDHTRTVSVAVAVGTPAQRRKAIEQNHDVLVINYENANWLLTELRGKWSYDVVICDESDKLKSHDSVRFKGKPSEKQPGLKHLSAKVSRWVNMTGTPAASGLHDLWSQMYLLDQGERLGKNITTFRNRWFKQDWSGYNYIPLPGSESEILNLISDLCLTMRAEDYLDLPPLVINDVNVRLCNEAMAHHRTLKNDFITTLDDTPVTAANAAVVTSKLRQCTSGFLYTEGEDYSEFDTSKLDALDDIIGELNGQPVLVFYHWKASLQRIMYRFKKAVVLDKAGLAVEKFNAGQIPILLAHPQSAGHGLSLHHSCSNVVFYDLDWDLRTYQQAIERVGPARQAQGGYNRTVVVHRLLAEDTIDLAVKKRLDNKADIQDLILDWMKE